MYKARAEKRKQLAVLIDPDTPDTALLTQIVEQVNSSNADLIFLGGSLLVKDVLDECIKHIKSLTDIPVILFPGSILQISSEADAILFISLISGRNPELLIGNQVISAPYIRQAGLEALATGYMLIDSGTPTTASYMSGSLPIPYHKNDIAACTAMAGEMLGQKLIYMDGGSGADKPVSTDMIAKVRASIDVPIIIGGGIRSAEAAQKICKAGADIIVVGNASEKNPAILQEIAEAVHQL
jgi:putative glycerol-1-phosphate prenyltransferase